MTKQERVYQALRERILAGIYGPGYRVVIDTLAEEFGVSAIPVREAIRRLEAEGLIVFRPNAGAHVTPADPGAFEAGMSVLALLEGSATATAAPLLGAEGIRRLTEINSEMSTAVAKLDMLRFGRLNLEFHAVIYESCPNPVLVDLLHDIAKRMDAIRRTVFIQIPYRGTASVDEHVGLIQLIASNAPAAEIELAARKHKLNTLESFQEWQREQQQLLTAAN